MLTTIKSGESVKRFQVFLKLLFPIVRRDLPCTEKVPEDNERHPGQLPSLADRQATLSIEAHSEFLLELFYAQA